MAKLDVKQSLRLSGWTSIPPVDLSIWGGVISGFLLGGLILGGWFTWQNRSLPSAAAAVPGRGFGPNSLGMEFREILFRPGVFMGFREVTAGQFAAYCRDSGSEGKAAQLLGRLRGDQPVNLVSFTDADAFATWLTQKERASGDIGARALYRLPHDEEWSLAAGLVEDGWRPDLRQEFSEKRYEKAGDKYFRLGSTTKFGILGLESDPMEWCINPLNDSGQSHRLLLENKTNNQSIVIFRVVRGYRPSIPWERIGVPQSKAHERLGFRLIYESGESLKR